MKREAFNHPKLQLLARDLHVDLCYARGIIESLWLVAQTNFPAGDVGRWSDEEIAIGMGYGGDHAVLLAILRHRKLLDPIPDDAGRLYVHDWHEHADDWVHARLARAGQTFANGVPPHTSKLSQSERERLAKFSSRKPPPAANGAQQPPTAAGGGKPSLAKPSIENSTVVEKHSLRPAPHFSPAAAAAVATGNAVGTHTAETVKPEIHSFENGSSSSINATVLAKRLAKKHPRPGRLGAAVSAIENEHLTAESAEQMVRSHEEYVAYYARAQPEFIPNLALWVADGDWLKPPPDAAPSKKPVSSMMRLAMELEEEQREKRSRRAAVNGSAKP